MFSNSDWPNFVDLEGIPRSLKGWEELVIPQHFEINKSVNEERCRGGAAVLQTYAKTYEPICGTRICSVRDLPDEDWRS